MFKESVSINDELKYVETKFDDELTELLNIKSSKDSYPVDFPVTKSTSTLKFGPFIGGHLVSSCSFNTTVSINGFVNNFVIQKVEFVFILDGSGEYNFNIVELISLSTTSFPKESIFLVDNVQLSLSQDEINTCSEFPKFAKCVRYLLSFSGSVNFNFSIKASYIDFFIISSSNWIAGYTIFVIISYSFPSNSTSPDLLYGFKINVTVSLPFQFGYVSANFLKLILKSLFAVKFLNKDTFVLSFNNKSTLTLEAANVL